MWGPRPRPRRTVYQIPDPFSAYFWSGVPTPQHLGLFFFIGSQMKKCDISLGMITLKVWRFASHTPIRSWEIGDHERQFQKQKVHLRQWNVHMPWTRVLCSSRSCATVLATCGIVDVMSTTFRTLVALKLPAKRTTPVVRYSQPIER